MPQPLHVVQEQEPESDAHLGISSRAMILAIQWVVGTILLFALGSWLVWFSAYLQRSFVEDEVRAACQRVMPETVQRCVDTVIIQRGGTRR